MKKRRLLVSLFVCLLLSLSVLISAADISNSTLIEKSQVDKAYSCLEESISNKGCDKISTTEKIFSLMAIGKCKSELMADSKSGICWPQADCSLKTTAQAILALEKSGELTTNAENWVLSKNDTPSDVDWFLQIEVSEPSKCEIKYSTGSIQNIDINADKTISGSAGSCLSKSTGDYWLRISPNCYGVEFEISCKKSFLTNLLFKDKSSSTIHVSETTSSSSAEGTTKEKVISLCLEENGKCDYEGTLWSAIALKAVGQDITPYMPYLITGAEKNTKVIPEALLYILTSYDEFRNLLLQKQKKNQYWDESGNKFYDTALALFPFQYSGSQEKQNSIDWLMEIQQDDGCWDGGNVLSNSFLLSSIWPKQVKVIEDKKDCENSGFYCMSEINCAGKSKELGNYACSSGVFICCDTPKEFDICKEQEGEICTSSQDCKGGNIVEASDTRSGEKCCVNGRCETTSFQNECEQKSGVCRSSSCASNEQSNVASCDFGDVCCIQKQSTSLAWEIWLLIILIILVILGIIFKDKLRFYWFRMSSIFKKTPPPSGMRTNRGPVLLPHSKIPFMSQKPRKVLPFQSRMPVNIPFNSKSNKSTEFDDILNKLKEMGK